MFVLSALHLTRALRPLRLVVEAALLGDDDDDVDSDGRVGDGGTKAVVGVACGDGMAR